MSSAANTRLPSEKRAEFEGLFWTLNRAAWLTSKQNFSTRSSLLRARCCRLEQKPRGKKRLRPCAEFIFGQKHQNATQAKRLCCSLKSLSKSTSEKKVPFIFFFLYRSVGGSHFIMQCLKTGEQMPSLLLWRYTAGSVYIALCLHNSLQSDFAVKSSS